MVEKKREFQEHDVVRYKDREGTIVHLYRRAKGFCLIEIPSEDGHPDLVDAPFKELTLVKPIEEMHS